MRRILLVAFFAAAAGSCGERLHHVVTLTFNDPADAVTIATSSRLGKASSGTPEFEEIARAREELVAGRDEWGARFANLDPKAERITFQKEEGLLQEVDHSASVAPESLQKFFFDTPLSVSFVRGPGWAELTIYAGASTRATRQQKAEAEKRLAAYAEKAKVYFQRVASMYHYLDEKPQRAEAMWLGLSRGGDAPVPGLLSEREEGLVSAVRSAADAIVDGDGDQGSMPLNQELDLVYNPFPAELHVVVPGEPLAVEGFSPTSDGSLVIRTVDALAAVAMLEGRWISPDPLAIASRSDKNADDQETAAAFAREPRRAATLVTADDVASALVETMRPAPRYRVRWVTRMARPSS